MAALTCIRCTQSKEALERAPFRGDLGKRIHESVCRDCWAEWQATQTKIINEYRLSLGDARGQQFLDQQMHAFLNLGDPPAS